MENKKIDNLSANTVVILIINLFKLLNEDK